MLGDGQRPGTCWCDGITGVPDVSSRHCDPRVDRGLRSVVPPTLRCRRLDWLGSACVAGRDRLWPVGTRGVRFRDTRSSFLDQVCYFYEARVSSFVTSSCVPQLTAARCRRPPRHDLNNTGPEAVFLSRTRSSSSGWRPASGDVLVQWHYRRPRHDVLHHVTTTLGLDRGLHFAVPPALGCRRLDWLGSACFAGRDRVWPSRRGRVL